MNGVSQSSFGVVGITTQKATSTSNARAGVLGEDFSTNENYVNSGVAGTSPYGSGVYGSSINSVGVLGSSRNVGVCGNNDSAHATNAATYCELSGPVGVSGNANNGWGVFGFSQTGPGIEGYSSNGTGGVMQSGSADAPALIASGGATGVAPTSGRLVFSVQYNDGSSVFNVDQLGNLEMTGRIVQTGSSQIRTKTKMGRRVISYGARTSLPTLEDFGQGHLLNGVGVVRLERTFASSIDQEQSYMVFLTPYGSSGGLYVANKTSGGFEVRENKSGRSTLDFDYRVVAKPVDTAGTRLADDTSRDRPAYRLHTPKMTRMRR